MSIEFIEVVVVVLDLKLKHKNIKLKKREEKKNDCHFYCIFFLSVLIIYSYIVMKKSLNI